MLFSRGRKPTTTLGVTMLACLAFVALAVWGWGLPLEAVGKFFLISLVMIVGLMLAAVVGVVLLRLVKKIFGKSE